MKKITTICALLVAFVCTTALGQQNSKAEFKFEKETHDFGKIPQNEPVSYEFSFTNVGTEPIIISEVRPSCGCSVAEFTKTPVKPGETGTIKVTYDAKVKQPFTKNFTVRSNTKTPVKTLYIKGEVTG
ncbi:DUF1573 domain-containing protein [Parapedobacter koreensis]|uniref:DUF1573 domain-containing protein n=1 Tax=Parapedobacter koreensis TaxID=332977 RepID=A0A1H7TR05_9SPHI|nr:DUF1573 domain-containing protein [Parapedobacter koreensis]SEL87322.1 Protein of unknown function [Parapedobacter koreensis]